MKYYRQKKQGPRQQRSQAGAPQGMTPQAPAPQARTPQPQVRPQGPNAQQRRRPHPQGPQTRAPQAQGPQGAPPKAATPGPASEAAEKATHWQNVAEWYDTHVGDEGSEYHREVILPGLLRLLAPDIEKVAPAESRRAQKRPLANLRVLDLACGQGAVARGLATAGARVTGIDAAAGLIEAARRREAATPLAIGYHVADVTKLVPLPAPLVAGSFDAVTIVLAIQNITPLSPVWQACHAALVAGGRLVVVMMHPCFRVFKQSGWHWDEAARSQSRLVTQYLSSSKAPIQMRPGEASSGGAGETTTSFHRPLQAYVNTLANAGLLIDHVDEWPSHRRPPKGPRFDALDASRREIPLFMALRARKVSHGT